MMGNGIATGMGWGMGFGVFGMLLMLAIFALVIVALLKYIRS